MAKTNERKRWIATTDAIVSWPDGQVRHVKEGEIILAAEAPSHHFEPAGDMPGEPVTTI